MIKGSLAIQCKNCYKIVTSAVFSAHLTVCNTSKSFSVGVFYN